jgi:hypothetical protein
MEFSIYFLFWVFVNRTGFFGDFWIGIWLEISRFQTQSSLKINGKIPRLFSEINPKANTKKEEKVAQII